MIYLEFISKRAQYFLIIGYAVQLWATLSCFFLPESPRLLIKQNKFDDAEASFKLIARWNRKPLVWDEQEFINARSFLSPDFPKRARIPSIAASSEIESDIAPLNIVSALNVRQKKTESETPPVSYFLR